MYNGVSMDRYSENTAHHTTHKKQKSPGSYLVKAVITFAVLLAVEGFLFFVLQYLNEFSLRFDWVVSKLEYVEHFILDFMSAANNIALTILVILFIYFIKAYVPFLPLSIVCMMSGIVFGKYWWIALCLNLLGLAGMFYLRFNSGRVKGENYMQNLLRKNKYVRLALDVNGVSSYSLLAVFRFFPCFPLNFVSRLYGANRDCKFQWYMLVSMLAIAPRVYVYTRIGKELFNPFTRLFVILLMILAAFSGLGIFAVFIVSYIKRRRDEKSGIAEPEEPAEEAEEHKHRSKRELYIPIVPEELAELEGAEFDDIQNLRNKFKGREL